MSIKSDHTDRWDTIKNLIKDVAPVNGTPKEKMKYISRVDKPDKSAHYWIVNIKTLGERLSKTFCDKKLGGKSSALLAAISFRNKEAKKRKLILSREFKKQPHDPTKKGVYLKYKTSEGYTYPYMVAYWSETIGNKRKRRYKVFSVTKHGFVKARKLAVKYRKDRLRELYG